MTVTPALGMTGGQDPAIGVIVQLAGESEVVDDLVEDAEIRTYDALDAVALEATPADIRRLAADPAVKRVERDILLSPESLEFTVATSAHALTGRARAQRSVAANGVGIAIVDTGIDRSHPFVDHAIVHEACFSMRCPNGQTTMIGRGAAAACTYASSCSHGTHVAGIVAGSGSGRTGVAPTARLVSIQVFSQIDSQNACGAAPPCARARLSDVLAALEHLNAIAPTHDIAAVNLSVSSDAAHAGCDDSVLKTGIDALRGRGVATIVSSGNGGSTSGLGLPACVSTAVSVGAVYGNTDQLWPLTNIASTLDLLAPGVGITSSVPGGGFESATGTSAAAPRVSGAWALATRVTGTRAVHQVLAHLRSTGVPVHDPRTGLIIPRLDLSFADSLPPSAHVDPLGAPADASTSYVPVGGDFNGDGQSDVFWYGASGDEVLTLGGPAGLHEVAVSRSIGTGYEPVQGDFDGDGRDDVFFHGPGARVDRLWFGRADGQFDEAPISNVRGAYKVLVGDFDGDGSDDIFWHAPGSARDYSWFGRPDRTFDKRSAKNVGGTYRVVTGDFNGDRRDDIIWHAPGGAADYLWLGRANGTFDERRTTNVGGTYDLLTGDFNGDGRDDLVWSTPHRGADHVWFGAANGTFTTRRAPALNSSAHGVVGDFDRDGRDDVGWYRPGPEADPIWYGRANGFATS